eukprot:1151685-Pelagomonas_calceolata.AAC.1
MNRPHTVLWLAKACALPASRYACQIWDASYMRKGAEMDCPLQTECGHEPLRFRSDVRFYNLYIECFTAQQQHHTQLRQVQHVYSLCLFWAAYRHEGHQFQTLPPSFAVSQTWSNCTLFCQTWFRFFDAGRAWVTSNRSAIVSGCWPPLVNPCKPPVSSRTTPISEQAWWDHISDLFNHPSPSNNDTHGSHNKASGGTDPQPFNLPREVELNSLHKACLQTGPKKSWQKA